MLIKVEIEFPDDQLEKAVSNEVQRALNFNTDGWGNATGYAAQQIQQQIKAQLKNVDWQPLITQAFSKVSPATIEKIVEEETAKQVKAKVKARLLLEQP